MNGSLVNTLMGGNAAVTPEVGMGATVLHWSDRSPATIVAVSASGTTITVKADNYTRTDSNGMSESQTYTFEPNPDARPVVYTLRKNGRWVRKGESMNGGQRIAIGYRDAYYDYSF